MKSTIESLLSGAIDLHIHASFENPPRRQNMLEVARDAAAAGMRAVVFKSKDTCTVDSARLAGSLLEGVGVYGGITLDWAVGGLNPLAVRSALERGGKIVWMPSYDAAWTISQAAAGDAKSGAKAYQKMLDASRQVKGICIFKGGLDGSELLPEVREIIAMVAAAKGAILETSHISVREALVLVREARKAGLERVVVTHVNSEIIGATIDQQKALAAEGAFLMYAFAPCLPSPYRDAQPIRTVVEMIRQVGPEHCVLATDLGRINYPLPVEGMRTFLAILLLAGIQEKDIERMVKINPAYLLGL